MERERLNKILQKQFNSEVLSPEEYLERYEKNREEFVSAEIITPEIGSGDSGYILVKRHNSQYAKLKIEEDSFKKLLSTLGKTPNEQGENYENLRLKLINIFISEGIASVEADNLADLVLDRVAHKITEGLEVENIALLAGEIARMVSLKYQRKAKEINVEALKEEFLQAADKELDTTTETLLKLEKAFERLNPNELGLLLNYYELDERNKLQKRQSLAERQGITIKALRLKVFQLKQKLEKIMADS